MSSRGKPITNQMKLERRKQADKRNEEYDKLTLEQKLAKLPADGAKRQRARLEAAIEAAKKPAKKVEVSADKTQTEQTQVAEDTKKNSKSKKSKKSNQE